MLDFALPAGIAPPSTDDDPAMRLGRSFVDTIVVGDFDRLETLFAPDVRFRAIVPRDYQQASTAAGARALVEDWFSGLDQVKLLGSTVHPVGDRLTVGYRLELIDAGEPRIVEQHAAATVDGAVFRDIALVCSGFRPSATDADGATAVRRAGPPSGSGRRSGAPAFTPAARLDATGLSCATLTPTISATVRGLDFGSILEIVTDDPEAEEGLRSWTRLTGNELVATEIGPGSARRFAVRRSPRDAAASTGKGVH